MPPTQEQIREVCIKKSRRDLLTTLKMYYPVVNPTFREIKLVMPDVEEQYLRIDLEYLCDKGYVKRVHERANQPRDEREYRLTAAGVETADRINKDPALEA